MTLSLYSEMRQLEKLIIINGRYLEEIVSHSGIPRGSCVVYVLHVVLQKISQHLSCWTFALIASFSRVDFLTSSVVNSKLFTSWLLSLNTMVVLKL